MAAAVPSAPRVVQEMTESLRTYLDMTFKDVKLVALDLEGISLGRHGKISIVQLSTPEQCFLFDMLGKRSDDALAGWLRPILESRDVVKIIHDCRMDADALMHHLGIRLENVHDTSSWNAAISGTVDANLNDTLAANLLMENKARDPDMYKINRAFWAVRPLTRKMIDWAAGDIESMFDLHRAQTAADTPQRRKTANASAAFFLSTRDRKTGFVTVAAPWRFIGPGGSKIRALRKRTDTEIYSAPSDTPGFHANMYLVYYSSQTSFDAVNVAARSS